MFMNTWNFRSGTHMRRRTTKWRTRIRGLIKRAFTFISTLRYRKYFWLLRSLSICQSVIGQDESQLRWGIVIYVHICVPVLTTRNTYGKRWVALQWRIQRGRLRKHITHLGLLLFSIMTLIMFSIRRIISR